MTGRDFFLHVKVAIERVRAAARPGAQPISVEDLLKHGGSRNVVDAFHSLWYASEAPAAVHWQGHPILKSPFDLWMYQELIVTARPDVIIETGTHRGGSALFFADMAQIAGHPMDVVTIDFNPKIDYDPGPHRITSIRGISTADSTFGQVRAVLDGKSCSRERRVMVVLDSDHSKQNVMRELRLYADLVTPGQWLVVEDTNVNGHPVLPEHGEGPYEAVEEFLSGNPPFTRDLSCERFLFTQNPGGWLRRLQPQEGP
ncbi:MAG: CmcI family methyltransferase [Acidobacteriota bacterium]